MQQPISVGKSFGEWWWIGMVLLTLALSVAAAFVLVERSDATLPVLILFGLSAVTTLVAAVVIALGRRSVTVTPRGFAVTDRQGTRGFTDDQVICVTIVRQNNYSSGVLKSVTRKFLVWVAAEEGTELIPMVNRVKVGQEDPLAELIGRVHTLLLDRARKQLEAGEAFDGEGWTLERGELIVAEGKRQSRAYALRDLAAAGIFDEKVCVWEKGTEEPVIRVPMQTANALVLFDLLQERIPQAAEGEAARGESLGRVLFERKWGFTTTLFLWLFGIVATLFTVGYCFVLVAMVVGNAEPKVALFGLLFPIVGWLLFLLTYSQRIAFRCHEYGVCRRTPFREDRLRYEEVGTFTYNTVRQFVNGVYAGTTLTMKFEPLDPERRKINYSAQLRNLDAELDNLRDHISGVIAARMIAQHRQGQRVPWTTNLAFVPGGLEYRPSGFFGRGEPQVARFGDISGMNVDQGWFVLWVNGQTKPVVKENVAQPNFFPGFLALVALFNQPRTADPDEVELIEDAAQGE